MDLSQFDDRCLEALSIAQAHAVRRGHPTVGEWHLLVALCQQEGGVTPRMLAAAGCSAALVARLVESQLEKMPSQGGTLTRIGAEVEALFESARREANARVSRRVRDFHLLMAFVQSETLGGELLRSQGITQAKIQRARESSMPNATTLESSSWLSTYGRDFAVDAVRGRLDPVIGREKEIRRTIQILLRRSKNNPLLVGEPGVGKTAMVEAIAARIARGKVPRRLRGKRIVSVDLGAMVAGTLYRGMFEKRLNGVVKEAVSSKGQIILFFDEAHCLVGAGSAMDRSTDAANLLKPALARGELRVIAATTSQEYRSHFSKDPALERRFQPIVLEEQTVDETVAVLRGLKPLYEKHHHVRVVDEALLAAATLSKRYLPDRRLPDKAIDVLDEAAAARGLEADQVPIRLASMERRIVALEKARQCRATPELDKELGELRTAAGWLRAGWQQTTSADRVVSENDVAHVVASWSGVPVANLLESETQRLQQLESRLRSSVIGQSEAARLVARAVLRARAGVKAADRPIGSFLFVGPTGVGKTEMAKAIARHWFGEEKGLVRIQMSELSEANSVTRLIGAPPGCEGSEEGGLLTEAVRKKPYSVVLFDELEKAHLDVQHFLLQVLDEGRLTDARGRDIDFKNTLMILTSNAGWSDTTGPIGFGNARRAQREIAKLFSPELINRFDAIVGFRPLTKEDMRQIVELQTHALSERLAGRGVQLTWSSAMKVWLAERGFDPTFGARPLRRLIETEVETELAERLLVGGLEGVVTVDVRDGRVAVFPSSDETSTGVSGEMMTLPQAGS
jgi:ATP-dependent Clp protease ATP-binding subunit ClpC